MNLYVIGPQHIDRAWQEGAHLLGEATKFAPDECTPSQLKLRLALGHMTLLCIRDDEPAAWLAVSFQQLSNMRVLHIHAIYAPGKTSDDAFLLVEQYARQEGASAIQGACSEAVARLWQRRFGFSETYRIMRKPLWTAAEATAT
jgi:hypothetical protein